MRKPINFKHNQYEMKSKIKYAWFPRIITLKNDTKYFIFLEHYEKVLFFCDGIWITDYYKLIEK